MSKITITTQGMGLNRTRGILTIQMSQEDLDKFLAGEFPIGGTLVTFETPPLPVIAPGEEWQGPLAAKDIRMGDTVQNPFRERRGVADFPIRGSSRENESEITGVWLRCDDGYTKPIVTDDRAEWYRLIGQTQEKTP